MQSNAAALCRPCSRLKVSAIEVRAVRLSAQSGLLPSGAINSGCIMLFATGRAIKAAGYTETHPCHSAMRGSSSKRSPFGGEIGILTTTSSGPSWSRRPSGTAARSPRFHRRLIASILRSALEIAREPTGHGLPLSKCEAYKSHRAGGRTPCVHRLSFDIAECASWTFYSPRGCTVPLLPVMAKIS